MKRIIVDPHELRQLKLYKLLHRLCKEVNIPRSKRTKVWIVINSNKGQPTNDIANLRIDASLANSFIIKVGSQWLGKHLTKKEFVQYAKLRLKF